MESTKILFDNKWVQIFEKQTENNGNYVFAHHPWCKGMGVAILPYKIAENGEEMFLGRYEYCPAHGDGIALCSLTGGYDNSHKFTIEECVLNELREEGGYEGKLEDLVSLGTVRPSKSSDSTTYLFTIDIDKCKPCEAVSDGTLGEVGAYCSWVKIEDVAYAKDPLLQAMLVRIIDKVF